jgi:hypothetical protein
MFVPLWILVPAALLLLFLLVRPLLRSRGDMIERQRRATGDLALNHPPRPGEPDPMSDPQIRAAIEGRRKIEAVKLARERYGLGLKEAKDLIERQTGL